MRKISARAYAFSAFVFDPDSSELIRGTTRFRIPDQEARVLKVFVENPGVVVTREQLRAAFWAHAILRVRTPKAIALIETLPKRGYRFVAPVQQIACEYDPSESPDPLPPDPAVLPPQAASLERDPTHSSPGVALALPQSPLPSRTNLTAVPDFISPSRVSSPLSRVPYYLSSAAICIALIVVLFLRDRSPATTHVISLGIVPMETSGDGVTALAETFRLNLADILSQSPEIETRSVHAFDNIGQDETLALTRARQMNIDVLLFGKFSVENDICHLRLELVRSRDGIHLTSLLYSGSKEQLASISDHVERDIFDHLHPNGKAQAIPKGRPRSAKAYAEYLEGRLYLQQWTNDSLHQAISAFGEALKEDPLYARADAGMASAYFVLSQHSSTGQDAALEQARHFSTSALALDPGLAEAHAILGQTLLARDWNFPLAEQHLYRAIELDPDHAIYHQWLSILLGIERKYDLALKEVDKAHAADPDWPPLYMTEIYLSDSAGQFDRSIRATTLLLQKMPNWSLAHEQCALSDWARGDYEGAIAQWRQAAVLEKDTARIQLEDQGLKAFHRGGVSAVARLRLEAIRTGKGLSHQEQDFLPAEWYAYAGDRHRALDALEAMVKSRAASALQIADDPAYRSMHGEPRYVALVKSIGVKKTSR